MLKTILKMSCLTVLVLASIIALSGCSKIDIPLPKAPAITTITTAPPNQIFKGQTWDVFPPSGLYVQAGQTLTLSWSADGGLVGYIFTTNQYNNWRNAFQSGAYEGSDTGSQGSVTVTIQNGDTYCAVLYNSALNILGSGPSVKVYQATLTER